MEWINNKVHWRRFIQSIQPRLNKVSSVAVALPKQTNSLSANTNFPTTGCIFAQILNLNNKKTTLVEEINTVDARVTATNSSLTTVSGYVETLIGSDTGKSVREVAAAEVAKIVADADESFDTLKEIADWILNDTTGAADMANDIAALEAKMEGIDATVVAKIAAELDAALKVDGANKYALASELSSLADRVKAIEDAGYQNAAQVGSAIDAKIAALDLANAYDAKGAAATAEVNAKAYADGLNTAMDTRVKVLEAIDHNFDVAGSAAQALTDAKAYTDAEVAKIQALTEAEILAAIAEVQA